MNVRDAADRLEASGRALVALLDGLDEERAHLRPEGGTKWSVVEIVGHMVDGKGFVPLGVDPADVPDFDVVDVELSDTNPKTDG